MGNRKSLWLTYAWVDNEDADVDFVAGKLSSSGVDVRLDRTRIVAGRRVWQQIDTNLLSADLNGFAIFATENSLRSEACQEELAIVLDRVLRQKGPTFPLIGIFPTPIDRALIPSSIATRLYVSLKDDDWCDQIVDSLSGAINRKIANPSPYAFKEHLIDDGYVYEMRPRDGVWHPPFVAIAPEQFSTCKLPFVWAKNQPHFRPAAFFFADLPEKVASDGRHWKGYRVDQQIDSTQSLYLPTSAKLRRIAFGNSSGPQYSLLLDDA